MTEEKYLKGEEFLEVAFELPNVYKIGMLAEEIMKRFPMAVNIVIIPCKMVAEPPRLSVSKDDYSHTIYNSKQKSQIMEEEKK